MNKSYYEAHITLNPDNWLMPESVLKKIITSRKWKYSRIDGDANLGDGVKAYATRQYNANKKEEEVLKELHELADTLNEFGWAILRRKIEVVIFDDRSSLVRFECKGACPECHTED